MNLSEPTLKTKQANLTRILRTAMQDLGINQSQLANRAGVAPTTISAWLNNTQMPDELNRKRLAEAICYTIERFDAEINGTKLEQLPITLTDVIDFVRHCSNSDFATLCAEVICPRIIKTSRGDG